MGNENKIPHIADGKLKYWFCNLLKMNLCLLERKQVVFYKYRAYRHFYDYVVLLVVSHWPVNRLSIILEKMTLNIHTTLNITLQSCLSAAPA